jgi:hypothetical protein
MSFMQAVVYDKAPLYSADCARCGSTLYWHPYTSVGPLSDFKAATGEDARCSQCVAGTIDPETTREMGEFYAGRYSAPGYLDCTDWSYGEDADALRAELNDLYGDGHEIFDDESLGEFDSDGERSC